MNEILLKTSVLYQEKENIGLSGFETVLFNKQLTCLINCPNTATGSYVIPKSVDCIGIEAFSQCKEVTSVIVPESLKKIGCLAFENCKSIVMMIIPGSVEEIGYRAFSNCTGLKSIFIQAKLPVQLKKESDVFHNIDKSNCILYVPTGSKKFYQQADQWKDFCKIVEKNEILIFSLSN